MKSDVNLSDLALANVEALADNESDPGRTLVSCTHATLTGNPDEGNLMWVCTGCVYKMAKNPSNTSECYIYH